MRSVQRWTKETIVAALRERHQKQQSLAWIAMPSGLVQSAAKRFGGYAKAIEAAGLDYELVRRHKAWDKQKVILEIRKLHAAGAKMSTTAIKTESPALYGAIRSHFGAFAEAMQAAGGPYPPKKPLAGGAKSGVLQMLRQLHDDGEDLRFSSMKKRRAPLLFAARYYFDSYAAAVKRAGLDYDRIAKEQLRGAGKWRRAASAVGIE